MTLKWRYVKIVFNSVTPYSLVHAGNRSRVDNAIPDTNLTVTGTYG